MAAGTQTIAEPTAGTGRGTPSALPIVRYRQYRRWQRRYRQAYLEPPLRPPYLYRGSRDADKLREQVLFDEVRQRQRVEDLAHQIGPVFEQENSRYSIMPKLIAKPNVPLPIRNALPARYCPPCNATSESFSGSARRWSGCDPPEAAGPVRQAVEDTGDDFRELRVVLLQLGVNHVQFHRERGKDHHQRNKHDQADNAECEEEASPLRSPSAVRSLFSPG